MIRIASHLADMTRQRSDQLGNIRHRQFDQQIRFRHLPPKLRFDDVTMETGGQGFKCVQH